MNARANRGRQRADPRPALSVCVRCKPIGFDGPDAARPGVALAAALAGEMAAHRGGPPAVLRRIHCLSQCKRPCVVAFSHPERFTYLFGDLDAAAHAPDVIRTFRMWLDRPDGFIERAERPLPLQAGILGRVPPLGSDHVVVLAEAFHPPLRTDATP